MSNDLKQEGYIVSVMGVFVEYSSGASFTHKECSFKEIRGTLQANELRFDRGSISRFGIGKRREASLWGNRDLSSGLSLRSGYLLCGLYQGCGKIYQQTGIDTFSNVGFAKLYGDKNALTAADFLNDKVLPYFDREQMRVVRVLTDRGTEYGWRNLEHPYQLFLHLNGIEHTRTKARHPQTSGLWRGSIKSSRRSFTE